MSLQVQLQALGLSASEATVYLDLAEIGKATAHAISKRTKLPRTTVYWLLENLREKGLVSTEKKKSTTFYTSSQPEALLRMVQGEKRKAIQDLTDRELLATNLLEAVRPFFKGLGFHIPKLQIFEGEEALNTMLNEYLPLWQDSAEKEDSTWWGYQDPTFAEHYLDWLKLTWKVKRPNEVYKVMTNQTALEQRLAKSVPHRKMKIVPPSYSFASSIWIVGEFIILIMTSQKPHYAFQLRDPIFARNLRTVFKVMWDVSL